MQLSELQQDIITGLRQHKSLSELATKTGKKKHAIRNEIAGLVELGIVEPANGCARAYRLTAPGRVVAFARICQNGSSVLARVFMIEGED